MREHLDSTASTAQARAFPAALSVGMTDRGLVLGTGSVLVRRAEDGVRHLALDADRDRLLVLLSVARGAPVEAADVIHHVEAAAGHWQRGDKALANLRLVFSRLPRLADAGTVACLSLAEEVLDGGMAPDALMEALWPDAVSAALRKYNPAQPRVPAGYGIESGRWEFAGGDAANREPPVGERWRVAMTDDEPPADEKLVHPEHARDGRHDRGAATSTPVPLNDPLLGLPGGATAAQEHASAVSAAATAAAEAVGPGRGPVYGTAVHTELKARIRALRNPTLQAEESYLNGRRVDYGTPGSIRVDAAEGDKKRPHTIYDLKTGDAYLSNSRIRQFRKHLPDGDNVDIREVRP